MAKKVRVEMVSQNVAAMLKSPAMNSGLLRVAEGVAGRCGPGYVATGGTGGRSRTRAFVETTDQESYDDNARNATLARALGV